MTESAIGRLFLGFSSNKLQQLSTRVDNCLARLNDQQVWARGGENENTAGNLVLHLCGNVRQSIIAGIGGEPDTRHRDDEFSARDGVTTGELRERLSGTVTQAKAVIDTVSSQRLSDRLVIKGYDVSVLDAIYYVVEHFAMHAGQIIFITKMLTDTALDLEHGLQSVARHRHQAP